MSYITFNNGSGGTPGSDIRTLTGNSGGAIGPDASYNINIVGSGAVSVTGSGNTLTITDGGAASAQFNTDSGSAIPAANILQVLGSHGLNTTGSGNTVTVLVDNTLVLGDLSAVGAGTDSLTLTTGDLSLTTGVINLAASAATTGYINIDSVPALHSYGTTSIYVGNSGNFTNSGTDNIAIGESAMSSVTLGNYNIAAGINALTALTTGSSNIAIGRNAGNLITTEVNNIYIGNAGAAESSKIRIGTNAVHDACYIVGIDGVDVGNVVTVVTESGDQLGTADITAGTGVVITGTANTITIDASATTPLSFPCDVGTATPAANALTLAGSHGLNTSGAAATATFAIDNTITLGDLSAIAAGDPAITLTSGDIDFTTGSINFPTTTATAGVIFANANRFMHSYGTSNTFLGSDAGNFTLTSIQSVGVGSGALTATTSGDRKVAIGHNAMGATTSGGQDSIAIGFQSMNGVVTGGTQSIGIGTNCFSNAYTGTGCVAVGYQALDSCTSSDNCIAIGSNALGGLTGGGDNNIAIGNTAGSVYTTESNNITIGNTGTGTDSGVIRIGTNATHTSAYVTGIESVDLSTSEVVTVASDQLGSSTLTAGTNISITPGAGVITIAATADLERNYTSTSALTYTVLAADEYIGVDCSANVVEIDLPNAPSTGRVYTVKDSTGSAAAFNITVTTVGGVVTIDGATTYVMNTAYQAVNLIFNGTAYEIY